MLSDFAAPYVTTTQLVASMASIPLAYGIYKIFAFVYDELTSPIRHVPGPPNPSFIYGSFKQLSESVSQKSSYSIVLLLIPNRTVARWRRVGSTNTDQQFNSK
jgi:hypothetical protein